MLLVVMMGVVRFGTIIGVLLRIIFFGGMESLYYMLTLIPCCQIMLIILFYKVLLIMEF